MVVGNHHFGNIGDVWKHLVWAEIVATEQPDRIWETHAGAATYELTPILERQYGVYHYLEHAVMEEPLKSAAYTRALHDVNGSELDTYPGSVAQAMRLLSGTDTEYLVCDIEDECVTSIHAFGREHAPNTPIESVQGDGITAVFDALREAESASVTSTAIHIDPFETFAPSDECDRSPVDLFTAAVERGATTALWYGFESTNAKEVRQDRMRTEIEERFDDTTVRSDLWCGGVNFLTPSGTDVGRGPNLVGCHMLCGNLNARLYERCEILGQALADQYTKESLPSEEFGSLEFESFFA